MDIVSVSSLKTYRFPEKFFFFCCSSFESRCLTIPFHIPRDRIVSSFVFQFSEFAKFSKHNFDELKSKLPSVVPCTLSNSKPLRTADVICDMFKMCFANPGRVNVVIDITTFTRESILMILFLASHFKENISSCLLLYNSSNSMDYNWLSFKIKEFRSVVGFSGVMLPTKKLHLTVILGFEVDRARSIIDKYEPAVITIASGAEDCSINAELCEKNMDFVDQLNSFYIEKPQNITISVVDPLVAKKSLEDYLENFKDYNNVIAPLNTKLSTVGVGLMALEKPNVQICYTQMELYNFSSYSTPSEKIYAMELF